MRDQAGDLPFPRSLSSLLPLSSPHYIKELSVSRGPSQDACQKGRDDERESSAGRSMGIGYWERRHSIGPVRVRGEEGKICGRANWAMCSDG